MVVLEVLASIAAFQDAMYLQGKSAKKKRWGKAGSWTIVRQEEIAAWYSRMLNRFGHQATVGRRTLCYWFKGLIRDGYLHSDTERHTNQRGSSKLDLRPSIYKFTPLGRLWISRRQGWVANPVDHLAVQRIAQSGVNPESESSTSLSSAVDKAPTAPRGKTTAARRRTASTAS